MFMMRNSSMIIQTFRDLRQHRIEQFGKRMKKYSCARSWFIQASCKNCLLLLLWLLDLSGLPHYLHLTEWIPWLTSIVLRIRILASCLYVGSWVLLSLRLLRTLMFRKQYINILQGVSSRQQEANWMNFICRLVGHNFHETLVIDEAEDDYDINDARYCRRCGGIKLAE